MIARFFYTGLEIFTSAYATLKFLIKKSKVIESWTKKSLVNSFLSLLCVVVSIPILILLLTLTALFMLYKFIVDLILRIKYKKNYGGLTQGADSMWATKDEASRNIVNILFLLQFDKSKANLLDYVKKICEQRFFKAPRFTCVRRQFMGYVCFIKNQLSVDDVVKAKKFSNGDVCDAESLQKFVQKYSNKPLPKNDTAAWELIVGEEPMRLGGLESEQYPLLIRLHHTVGDGVTFFSLVVQAISDEGSSILDKSEPTIERSLAERLVSFVIDFPAKIKRIFADHLYMFPILEPTDCNILHESKLSGEAKIGFFIEDKPNYVEKVKRIKNVLGGTFSDVIFMAISASLSDYFEKNTNGVPSYITLSFMMMPNKDDVQYTHNRLGNFFSVGAIKLPMNGSKSASEMNLTDRYVKIKQEYKKFNDSYDLWMNYWLLQSLAAVLPVPILKRLVKSNVVSTVGFSKLPGFKRVHISRQALNHVVCWVPNFVNIGIGLCVITYDGRFQMGLLVDKLLISDEKEVQQILDDIFKYIDLLGREVERRQNV